MLYGYNGSSCVIGTRGIIGIIVGVIANLVCGYFSGRIASDKGYSFGAYFALTFFVTGIIGIIISCCLYDFASQQKVITIKKWVCHRCGRTNNEPSTYCSHCGEKKKVVETKTISKTVLSPSSNSKPAEKWKCPNCGYDNNINSSMCIECGKERP